MYAQEMPVIRDAMQADFSVFQRGAMFAVCSIRQATINVPDQLAALFDPTEDNNQNPLFGHKFLAWEFIGDASKCAPMWGELCRTYKADWERDEKSEQAIITLLRVPGLGIVKAAFVAQLMGFDVACLDARNIAREGRNPRAYETRGDKSGRKYSGAIVRRYVEETGGHAQEYWDAWCTDVAAAYGRTAQEISELHLAIVPPRFIPF